MVFYFAFYVLISLQPHILHNFFALVFLVSFVFTANVGTFWMLYQAIRYEERVGRYVLLALVPFMFVWYLLVRHRLRRELPRTR